MAMYGLVLRSDPEAAVQVWEPTEDVDDLLKPEDTFVLCDTMDAGQRELESRFPVPPRLKELLGNKRMNLCTVLRYGHRCTVYPRGLIYHVKCSYSEVYDIPDLAQGLVAVGGATISDRSSNHYGVASGQKVVSALRKDPVFAASDLVVRRLGDDDFDVLASPRKAKARKTLNATRAKRNAEKAAQDKLAAEASSTRTDVYLAAQRAAVALWESFSVLKQLRPERVRDRSYYGNHDDLDTFWKVVVVHETLGRKGKWRDLPEVVKLLDVFAGVGDAFDVKWAVSSYQKEQYDRLSAHCARLADEVKRLARKRRREQRKSERAAAAAKEEHPEPAAV